MTSGKTLLATSVVLLGVGCSTQELKGTCIEYKSIPVVRTECTRPTPQGSRICVDKIVPKYFCVRTDGGEEKSDDRREEYLFS